MGLAEKKWKRSIEEEYAVEFKNDVNGFLGSDIAVEFDWDSFSSADEIKFVPTYSLDRIKSALRTLSEDIDAKEEIVAQIKTIKIKNLAADSAADNKSLQLADNALHLAVGFGGDYTCVFNDSAIRDFLENNL